MISSIKNYVILIVKQKMTFVGDGMPEVFNKAAIHILSVPTIPVSHGEK